MKKYCVKEFPWNTPVKSGFNTWFEAEEWRVKHSGGVMDCRYVEEESSILRLVK